MSTPIQPGPATIGALQALSPDEHRALVEGAHNIVLIGPERDTHSVVAGLRSDLPSPVVTWHPGDPLPQGRCGGLIVPEISRLTLSEQQQFCDWLAFVGKDTQVVSTTSTSVQPLMEAGLFLERLYFRLNTLCVDLREIYAST